MAEMTTAGSEQAAAFTAFFNQYRRRAFAFALQLSGNREDAMDLAQEAFLRLHRQWGRGDPPQPLVPWFYKVLRHLAIDLLRKRAAGRECAVEPLLVACSAPSPEAAAASRELTARVWRAIGALPLNQREAVLLRDWHGLRGDRRNRGNQRGQRDLAAARRPHGPAARGREVSVNTPEEHVRIGGMLSAFLDGELTQAESQRVSLHLEDCPGCREALEEMRKIQRITAGAEFGAPPGEWADEVAGRLSVEGTRRSGWLLIAAGLAAWAVYALAILLVNLRPPTLAELMAGAVVLGVVLLFLSVARQRWLEYPKDRYRRVKR